MSKNHIRLKVKALGQSLRTHKYLSIQWKGEGEVGSSQKQHLLPVPAIEWQESLWVIFLSLGALETTLYMAVYFALVIPLEI